MMAQLQLINSRKREENVVKYVRMNVAECSRQIYVLHEVIMSN